MSRIVLPRRCDSSTHNPMNICKYITAEAAYVLYNSQSCCRFDILVVCGQCGILVVVSQV